MCEYKTISLPNLTTIQVYDRWFKGAVDKARLSGDFDYKQSDPDSLNGIFKMAVEEPEASGISSSLTSIQDGIDNLRNLREMAKKLKGFKVDFMWDMDEYCEVPAYDSAYIITSGGSVFASNMTLNETRNLIDRLVNGQVKPRIQLPKEYDAILMEKEGEKALTREEVINMADRCNQNAIYPIEVNSEEFECSAMGFITKNAAKKLEFDYKGSGFEDFIRLILDDKDSNKGEYTFSCPSDENDRLSIAIL